MSRQFTRSGRKSGPTDFQEFLKSWKPQNDDQPDSHTKQNCKLDPDAVKYKHTD